ncbi:hypothetical protein OIU76_020865, partial [Salix suchowensis]
MTGLRSLFRGSGSRLDLGTIYPS